MTLVTETQATTASPMGVGAFDGVRILRTGVARPEFRISQDDAARQAGALLGASRESAALARGSGIRERALVHPPEELKTLGSVDQRNAIYARRAPGLAVAAATAALREAEVEDLRFLVTSSCTGCMLPGWSVDLVERLCLPVTMARTPITEAGCPGGVVALARAADALAAARQGSALVTAVELCSLAFHSDFNYSTLASAILFGDGAGAALLTWGGDEGLAVVGQASTLVPDTRDLLRFDLTSRGFYPVIDRELAERVSAAAISTAQRLLAQHGLAPGDVSAWLIHPGGSRILRLLAADAGIAHGRMRWSWESLEQCGNMSSAAIFDVLRRYQADQQAGPGYALIAAFGPGLSVEMLLVYRPC